MTIVFQLRIYTLRSIEALEQYAAIHWTRHIPSLEAFGVTTHGIWTERGDANRLIALISYQDGADPTEVTSDYMASPSFTADMAGFDPGNIIDVDSMLLVAADSSPLR